MQDSPRAICSKSPRDAKLLDDYIGGKRYSVVLDPIAAASFASLLKDLDILLVQGLLMPHNDIFSIDLGESPISKLVRLICFKGRIASGMHCTYIERMKILQCWWLIESEPSHKVVAQHCSRSQS